MTSPRRTWSATRTVASPQTSSGRGRAFFTKSNWGRSTVLTKSKLRFAAAPTNVVIGVSGSHMAKSSMATA